MLCRCCCQIKADTKEMDGQKFAKTAADHDLANVAALEELNVIAEANVADQNQQG